MMNFFARYEAQSYALLRIISGLLFLAHGIQKFCNFPTEFPYPLSSMLVGAGAIELVAGGMIALGLLTRPAAFIASGMSAVGYWTVHGMSSPFPIANGGETIALYAFIFLFIATRGAGIWSIDALWQGEEDAPPAT